MQPLVKGFLVEGQHRKFTGTMQTLVAAVGIIMSLYQIWEATLGAVDPMQHESIHLTFVLALAFLYYSYSKRVNSGARPTSVDIIMVLLAIAAGVYYSVNAERFITRSPMLDPLTSADIFFGIVFLVLSFESARRTIGLPIGLIVVAFLLYAVFGQHLTGVLWHRPLSTTELIDQYAFTLNGIWGSPVAVASTFVFLFILFGSFLNFSGAGEFFFDLAMALVGKSKGGPSKVAVIASALFGTISGSPVANVVTTGTFTIPMAKRLGYTPAFAAAVEAVASTGGAIMPPIMGSSAFLMAELTGISYGKIIIAAAIPALLYYLSLIMMVHFEAVRLNLPTLPADQVPDLKRILKSGWQYLIPLLLLAYLLIIGRSPSLTAVYGILSVIVVSWIQPKKGMGLKKILQAMADGAETAIPVTTSCAAAGMVIAGLISTGLIGKLTSIILSVANGMMMPTLILVAIICLILGMGMPVAPAYLLTAILGGPALIALGIDKMPAHLFIVYFSIISAITPPVAVAAFAGAGLAGSNPNQTGVVALRLGIAGFLVPFMFVYQPALLSMGPIPEVILAAITASIGVTAMAGAVIGRFIRQSGALERLVLAAGGLLLIDPGLSTDLIGIALVLAVVLYQGGFAKIRKKTGLAA